MSRLLFIGLCCGIVMSNGCVAPSGRPLFGLQWPQLYHPGDATSQRNQAALNDPFPDAYAGPAYDGSRPREFSRPLAEPVRNRMVHEQMSSGS